MSKTPSLSHLVAEVDGRGSETHAVHCDTAANVGVAHGYVRIDAQHESFARGAVMSQMEEREGGSM